MAGVPPAGADAGVDMTRFAQPGQLQAQWVQNTSNGRSYGESVANIGTQLQGSIIAALRDLQADHGDDMELQAVAAQKATIEALNNADFSVMANKAALFTILYGVKSKVSKHRQIALPGPLVTRARTTMSFAEACEQLRVPLPGVTGVLTCAMALAAGTRDERL
eukprot:4899577-Amphidinium_carterae.1